MGGKEEAAQNGRHGDGSSLSFRIERHRSPRITGLPLLVSTEGRSSEIADFWMRVRDAPSFGLLKKLVPNESRLGIMGICLNDEEGKPGRFTYLIGIETPANRSILPEGCTDIHVKAGAWAVFETRGFLPDRILRLLNEIRADFFSASGYEPANAPLRVSCRPDGPGRTDFTCEVRVPIVPGLLKAPVTDPRATIPVPPAS